MVSGDNGIETRHPKGLELSWLWVKAREAQVVPTEQPCGRMKPGREIKRRMGDRCFRLCFGMGRPEQRGLTEGEDTGETTNTVERNENQELASPLGLGRESHTLPYNPQSMS